MDASFAIAELCKGPYLPPESSSSRILSLTAFEGSDDEAGAFTEGQIIGVLREQEVGAKGADLCRDYGMSETTLYDWKAKYGEVSTCRRPSV